MSSAVVQLTWVVLALAAIAALVLAGLGQQGKTAKTRKDPGPEFEPDDLRDQVILMLIDDGMDPTGATHLVEEITSDFPEYGLEEILEEARRR